ncbi:hypothetical protein JZ751_007576 [Albula glossodonta]|uniref:Ig-like domain-containing protein n=1 Tax=Albula glossodonta TaxID=121402 RepID=A0A8T2N2X0_9TELE|nr:hypothetical protein JZ751_007576 [Albula glossodonta]
MAGKRQAGANSGRQTEQAGMRQGKHQHNLAKHRQGLRRGIEEVDAVVMVDDVQVLYYDSNIRKLISRGHQNSSDGDDRLIEENGVHVLQRLAGCVLEKDRPSPVMEWDALRLLHTTCRDTGELRVSCLATGFYPRHINLTMLRDGLPVPEEELVLGGLLPNGDGTYQLRRTLRLSAEELGGGHHYTCSVTHLSLDNKLDISWEPGDGPNTAVITSVVVVVLALGLTSAIAACAISKRRLRVSEPEDSASHSSAN